MRIVCAACVAVLLACGNDGDDEEGDPRPGRGSAACQDWQDAICDLAVNECHAIDRLRCDDNYKGVTCQSDERASACANAFNAGSCNSPPPNCDLSDLADPAPAQAACTQLFDRLCERAVECDAYESKDPCLEKVSMGVDCSRALAFTLDYEACLSEVTALSCAAVVLPIICDDVIKVTP